jgi:membrane fusion protein, heavy metal efflux system
MMFANFSIITGTQMDAPAVPTSAIVYEGDTTRVWAQQGKNTVALRPVKIGRIADGMVEITDGLVPGEAVVTSGTLFIDRAAQSD